MLSCGDKPLSIVNRRSSAASCTQFVRMCDPVQ